MMAVLMTRAGSAMSMRSWISGLVYSIRRTEEYPRRGMWGWIMLLDCADYMRFALRVSQSPSFHACVFSILFHKPFGVFVNRYRGLSRIESLLQPLGLMDRCIADPSQQLDAPIDWTRVDRILSQWREKSMDFLRDALGVKA